MTISSDEDPKGGLELIGLVVPHLLTARPSSDRVIGGGGQPKTSPAGVAVYTLALMDAAKIDALAFAKFVGWRYLIDDNGCLAVAEIRPASNGSPNFSRLTRGPIAAGLQKAAEAASAAYGSSSDNYQPRILEVPALHAVSLWLHGKNDVFFKYIESNGTVPDKIDEDDRYLQELSAHALKKAERREAPATASGP